MKNNLLIIASIIGGLFFTLLDVTAAPRSADEKFITDSYAENMFCLLSSRLALEKSTDKDVRAFANRMISRHSWAKNRMENISKSMKIMLPKHLDSQHQRILGALHAVSGAQFDLQYLLAQKQGHADALSRFHAYAKNGTDKELKSFSRTVLGSLGRHHAKSQDLLANDERFQLHFSSEQLPEKRL